MRLRNIKTFRNDLFYLYVILKNTLNSKLPQSLDSDLTFENEQVIVYREKESEFLNSPELKTTS